MNGRFCRIMRVKCSFQVLFCPLKKMIVWWVTCLPSTYFSCRTCFSRIHFMPCPSFHLGKVQVAGASWLCGAPRLSSFAGLAQRCTFGANAPCVAARRAVVSKPVKKSYENFVTQKSRQPKITALCPPTEGLTMATTLVICKTFKQMRKKQDCQYFQG